MKVAKLFSWLPGLVALAAVLCTAVAPGRIHGFEVDKFGRMPVLEDGDFTLYETQAILRYLERVLPAPHLIPESPTEAARMDQIMGISDWYLFPGVSGVIGFHRIVAPRLMGLVPDEAAIAAAMPRAHVVFGELSRLLGTKAYLASSQLTLADLMVAPHMDFLAQTPEWAELSRDRRNLREWLGRMNDRNGMRATTWEAVAQLALTG